MKYSPSPSSVFQVLLVEDDSALRELLLEILEGFGLFVTAVGTADEGMELLQSRRWKLFITDVHTPGVTNGIELARAARKAFPDVGIIVMSGDHDQLEKALCLNVHFLPKPWLIESVIELVSPYLAPGE